MIAVGVGDDVPIEFETFLGDPRQPRRMKLHEPVAEVVDGVVIHGREIPSGVLQDFRGRGMHAHRLGNNLAQRVQPFVLVLIDAEVVGDEGLDDLAGQFHG